jgi:hypothetical protein
MFNASIITQTFDLQKFRRRASRPALAITPYLREVVPMKGAKNCYKLLLIVGLSVAAAAAQTASGTEAASGRASEKQQV